MSIDEGFFNQLYQKNRDPWDFATSPYELFRYHRICEVIQHKRHDWIFEAGCSIGVLTSKLAHLAKYVEAIDISKIAIAQAQRHCQHLTNVYLKSTPLPDYLFNPATDLIVLSEIGYYFTYREWCALLDKIISQMRPNTHILASHWLGESQDHLTSGDEVHNTFALFNELQRVHQERHQAFRLDYWIKK